MSTVTCKARAEEWVHWYAGGGAALAVVPIPMAGMAALGVIETTMIYWIAKVYGEELTKTEIAVVAAGLELGGFVFKAAALEACNLIPVAGWIVKASVAAGIIEGIGAAIIGHYEDKYPRKKYSISDDVEGQGKKKKAA
jgi:uncharacterized protein (DUF697 family)